MSGLQEYPDVSYPTDLQLRVLARVAAGQSYSRIGTIEHVSSRTVRRMIADLKRQAGVNNAVALGAYAAWRGWLTSRLPTGGSGRLRTDPAPREVRH